MGKASDKLGIWLVGIGGNVGTTVAVGVAALQQKLAPPIGLVTEQPSFASLDLPSLAGIVLGGHEVRGAKLVDTARRLHEQSRLVSDALLKRVRPRLIEIQRSVRPGSQAGCGRAVGLIADGFARRDNDTGRAIIDGLRGDLRRFRRRHRLDGVVVINVASTEPIARLTGVARRWSTLEAALQRNRRPCVPASSLYAIAAIEESMPYVNFTPSVGVDVPGIRELADARGVPIMGRDGKTGETLLKTVLAPMFRDRGLEILSWDGHNILGNMDGRVLAEPDNKASKLRTKGNIIESILGYQPQTSVSIEYIESLHDWKIAWDHVHFRGFLGTPMSLQFTWQGSDSILAAPLIIDLARLAHLHAAGRQGGVMTHLACFFKSPMGTEVHEFSTQVELLRRYVSQHAPKTPPRHPRSRKNRSPRGRP